MDISKLTHGIKVVLGASIAFLIVSIFNWQEIDFGIGSAGVSMWHGWVLLAGLLAIVIVVWEAIRLADVKVEIGFERGDGHGGSRDSPPVLHHHQVPRQQRIPHVLGVAGPRARNSGSPPAASKHAPERWSL